MRKVSKIFQWVLLVPKIKHNKTKDARRKMNKLIGTQWIAYENHFVTFDLGSLIPPVQNISGKNIYKYYVIKSK